MTDVPQQDQIAQQLIDGGPQRLSPPPDGPIGPMSRGVEPLTSAEERVAQERRKLHMRVDIDFRYHSPTPDQLPKYAEIRDTARELAHLLVDLVPPGRELSLALTKLEECVMHANSGVARHG